MPAAAAAAMASSNAASGSSTGGPRLDNTSLPPLRPPQPAHVHNQNPTISRPMHLLRAPSFNPPAFEEEQPPPPLVTPPPQYHDIASPTSGLADYFTRLADAYDEGEDSDDPDSATTRGRVNVPLTPGSRVNRSMELSRRDLWGGASGDTVTSPSNGGPTGRQGISTGRNDPSMLEGNAGVSESVAEATTPNAT